MTGYVVQRLGTVMFIMVAMSVLVFLATHALPSNAAALILGQYSTPETQAALEHKLGFDQPLPVQYWHWASHMLQGDMGQSFEMERPVAPILWDAFGRSAILAVSSMTVVSTLGLALGIVAAVWRGRWPDHAASISTTSASRCRSFIGVWSSSWSSAAHFICCPLPVTPISRTGSPPLFRIWCCQSRP